MRRLLTGLLESVPYLMAAGVVGWMLWLVVVDGLLAGNMQALWFAPLVVLAALVGVAYAVTWWDERY